MDNEKTEGELCVEAFESLRNCPRFHRAVAVYLLIHASHYPFVGGFLEHCAIRLLQSGETGGITDARMFARAVNACLRGQKQA